MWLLRLIFLYTSSLQGSGVTSDFKSLKGKRIGYVGEFGKVRRRSMAKILRAPLTNAPAADPN